MKLFLQSKQLTKNSKSQFRNVNGRTFLQKRPATSRKSGFCIIQIRLPKHKAMSHEDTFTIQG